MKSMNIIQVVTHCECSMQHGGPRWGELLKCFIKPSLKDSGYILKENTTQDRRTEPFSSEVCVCSKTIASKMSKILSNCENSVKRFGLTLELTTLWKLTTVIREFLSIINDIYYQKYVSSIFLFHLKFSVSHST